MAEKVKQIELVPEQEQAPAAAGPGHYRPTLTPALSAEVNRTAEVMGVTVTKVREAVDAQIAGFVGGQILGKVPEIVLGEMRARVKGAE